ncbi:avidin-like [Poecile atricapillus]|uniref:avidin-like n=1 Tax=Poecile atricapillus TaxID=48891 RepID=UPI0027399C32|nr:avidin-like [Poecile atricapillus]
MVQATPFLLVLFLALASSDLSTQLCSLTGTWKNDLGSNMTILEISENGDFAGSYYTAVSDTSEEIKQSPLLGSQHQPNLLKQPTFGFTVHWTFSDSITVFTGQCFVDEDGKEVLKTMWLLRSHADKRRDDWNATLVGYNEFKRLEKHMEPGW